MKIYYIFRIYNKIIVKTNQEIKMIAQYYRIEIQKAKFYKNKIRMKYNNIVNGGGQSQQTLRNETNIEQKKADLPKLTNMGRRFRSNRKNIFFPHCCLPK